MFKFKYKLKRKFNQIDDFFKIEKEGKISEYVVNKSQKVNVYLINWKYLFTCNNFDDASKQLNIKKTYIRLCCNEYQGFTWLYQFKYYNWSKKNIKPIKNFQKDTSIKINQYSLEGKYIETFNSLQEVERKLNYIWVNKGWISSCINWKTKTAYWFQWKKYNWNKNDIDVVKYSINLKIIYQYDLYKNLKSKVLISLF